MTGPHQGLPVLQAGERLEKARAAMILVHGRGADAADIIGVGMELMHPGFIYLAPEAESNTWYPNRFMEPTATNQPHLDSALAVLEGLTAMVGEHVPMEQVIIAGFSQGACLATEFVARHARRYGGVLGFSGGLIGPDDLARDYAGDFAGTPVFLGCSDVDPHIPAARVTMTGAVLERMGAVVSVRLYPGMGHTINADEINAARAIVMAVLPG